MKAIAFNELQDSQHEALLQSSIDVARKIAGDFENVLLTELAVEISVGLNQSYVDSILTKKPDDQLITTYGAPCQRFHPCSNKSVLLILDFENNRQC